MQTRLDVLDLARKPDGGPRLAVDARAPVGGAVELRIPVNPGSQSGSTRSPVPDDPGAIGA
jgi:hypothetical protein